MMLLTILHNLTTVEIFGGSYYLLDMNDVCNDKHKEPITNLLDCKEAAETIPHKSFVMEEISRDSPSGCYVYGKGIYFNKAVSESRQQGSRSICREEGKTNI